MYISTILLQSMFNTAMHYTLIKRKNTNVVMEKMKNTKIIIQTDKNDVKQRFLESFYGGLVGDVYGSVFEFDSPSNIPDYTSINEIKTHHPVNVFSHPFGHFTDDTIFMLLAMESITEKGFFDPTHQLDKMGDYIEKGRFSYDGTCFDIGNCYQTSYNHKNTRFIPSIHAGGNGVLMKMAPFALYSLFNIEEVNKNRFYRSVVRITHGEIADDSAIKMGHMLEKIYAGAAYFLDDYVLNDESMTSSGFCNGTFNLSLHYLNDHLSNNVPFDEALMKIIKRGLDTDTNACVLGQLIGCQNYDEYDFYFKKEVQHIINRFLKVCIA